MLPNIQSAADLITSRSATRDGFLKQALTKTRKAPPYIVEATELAAVLQATDSIHKVAHIPTLSIKNALYAAAGFSDKARGRMTDAELQPALEKVLETITASAPDDWRTEIVYRFLLTRGDTLGGSMRNVTGATGGNQLSSAIVAALEAKSMTYNVVTAPKNPEKISSLEWTGRLLVFDKKPRFIDNNIDAILLDTSLLITGTVSLETPAAFLACGELKGGIDPAGADEHWKTARSAFERIRDRFTKISSPVSIPALFFVGAAIETNMANEIFSMLEDGRLTYAANLTVVAQTQDLANWLISL